MLSRTAFGTLIFMALLALGFWFKSGNLVFLVSAAPAWLLGLGIALSALLLLFTGQKLNSRQLIAIGILYVLTPFACYSTSNNGAHFIILENHLRVALGLWAIAAIAWSMFFFQNKNQLTHSNS